MSMITIALIGYKIFISKVEANSTEAFRRYQSFIDRKNQWTAGWEYTKGHLIGKGIGFSKEVEIQRTDVPHIDTYKEFTNILEFAYYLGLLYLIPLLGLLSYVAYYILKNIDSKIPLIRILSIKYNDVVYVNL